MLRSLRRQPASTLISRAGFFSDLGAWNSSTPWWYYARTVSALTLAGSGMLRRNAP